MIIGQATFVGWDIFCSMASNSSGDPSLNAVVDRQPTHSFICEAMNHHIFTNVATNTNDGTTIRLSKTCCTSVHTSIDWFSGADIRHGCLPYAFGHVLFGKLPSLSDTVHPRYRGDRIYIKPEMYGLQIFPHYVARTWLD
jgi:hypothetical protein